MLQWMNVEQCNFLTLDFDIDSSTFIENYIVDYLTFRLGEYLNIDFIGVWRLNSGKLVTVHAIQLRSRTLGNYWTQLCNTMEILIRLVKSKKKSQFENKTKDQHISYAWKGNPCDHDDDVAGNRNENGRRGENTANENG